MTKIPGKINNSYEDESLSSSNSSRESDEQPTLVNPLPPPPPQPLYGIDVPLLIPPVAINEDPEKILNHIYKTRNSLIEKTKNLATNKLIKKEPPPLLSEIVTENSSNAVDIVDVRPREMINLRNEELTFNGRIENMLNKQSSSAAETPPRPIVVEDPHEEAQRMLAHDTSHMMITNEKSPDLFEVDDYDYKYQDCKTETESECFESEKTSTDDKSGCNTSSGNLSARGISDTSNAMSKIIADEEIFLNKLQLSLTGVLPPPSITITQINIAKMVQLYRENEKLMSVERKEEETIHPRQSSKLWTHTVEEAQQIPWPKILEVKSHGIHYNRSKHTEKIESLSLKYVDRNIGAETSSSFAVLQSPTSAKKRNMRLKMLRKSPGNRLSHLARRREIFSSENLAGHSSKSGGGSASLFGLGRNRQQIMVDPGRAGSKNSRKIKTPKRHTPGRRFTPTHRKTPTSKKKSSQKKRRLPDQPLQRETSKRALFQSPAKQPETLSIPQITPEIANRAQKSKRVLFSPEKLPRSTSFCSSFSKSMSENQPNENAFRPTIRFNSMNCLNEIHENTMGGSLKRKRDCENNENLIDQKIAMTERQKMTPNTMKMFKSLSFCANGENRDNVNLNLLGTSNRSLLFRSTSEIIPGSSAASSQSQLTEIHRKKLLWAVSHALQLKQITVKHEKFKHYAATLARVTKRLYLEYEQNTPGSTSEKMMKLTNRLVFFVMQDKTVDEIYEIESQNLEKNLKNLLEKSNSFQIYHGGNINLNKSII